VNEREETSIRKIDWLKPHVILEKLDGSMVSPCYVNGHIRWMTKMGITDTSMEAEAFVAKNPQYMNMAEALLNMDNTPIFEWCSNKNRIVLDYPEDRLVLTAIRSNEDGSYWTHSAMMEYAQVFNDKIPVVRAAIVNAGTTDDWVVDYVRQQEGIEGVVIRFDDGHMVKIKADWYVRIHKVKSLLGQERDVVALILNNELDDLLPVLPPEDVDRVEAFKEKLLLAIRTDALGISTVTKSVRSRMDRKTFALGIANEMHPLHKSMVFQFWDKECDNHLTYQAIVAMILKHCGNNASYQKVKEAFFEGIDYV
jgi:RNA ligase